MEILSSLPSCARQPCDFRRNQPRRSSGEAASYCVPGILVPALANLTEFRSESCFEKPWRVPRTLAPESDRARDSCSAKSIFIEIVVLLTTWVGRPILAASRSSGRLHPAEKRAAG